MKYLLSLQNTKIGKRLGLSSYCNCCSALFRLFQIFGKVQSDKFKLRLAEIFRGFKRKFAIELQDGDGIIQTGESPSIIFWFQSMQEICKLF